MPANSFILFLKGAIINVDRIASLESAPAIFVHETVSVNADTIYKCNDRNVKKCFVPSLVRLSLLTMTNPNQLCDVLFH